MLDAIEQCPKCSAPMGRESIIGTARAGSYIHVGTACGNCGRSGQMRVKVEDWKEFVSGLERPKKEDKHQRAREIGREVAAFSRIDLAPINTVEDLELYWHDQETFTPWTVVRERADGRHAI